MATSLTDEGNRKPLLDRPMFKLVTNDKAEEMGLNGSGQNIKNDDVLKSLRQFFDDKNQNIE